MYIYVINCVLYSLAADQVNQYYLGFFMNYRPAASNLSILLTTSETHQVQYFIEVPSINYYHSGFLSASNRVILYLPRSLEATYYFDQEKGISLTANSDKVTVIGLHMSLFRYISESYFALPIVKLKDDYVYYGVSVPRPVIYSGEQVDSSILIVGTEDNTAMKFVVTHSANVSMGNAITNLVPDRQYSFVVHKMQTVYIGSLDDLSGTKIITDKPISVLSGHECGDVPSDVSFCNYLIEQIPPTALWGKEYYTAPLADKKSYTIKILAAYASTTINIYCSSSNKDTHIINAGKFVNKTLSSQEYCAIYSNKEILVVQFSHGGREDSGYGNPMMTLVPATNQYLSEFDVSTIHNPLPLGYNYSHYVNIIVMAQYYQPYMIHLTVGEVTRSMATKQWIPLKVKGINEAYATQVEIPQGRVKIFHTNAAAQMSTIVYGFTARLGSYGHIGGIHLTKGC